MKKKTKWIKGAIKRPGAFKKYCGGEVTDACIKRGIASSDPKTKKQALLARTLLKMRKK